MTKLLVLMCLFYFSSVAFSTILVTLHRYFGTCIGTILQLYSSSHSASNQFLK